MDLGLGVSGSGTVKDLTGAAPDLRWSTRA